MQSISCEIPGWMKHKLESRLLGEILKNSDMQMKVKVKVTQLCLTLCDPMDCSWYSLGQNTGVSSLSFLQEIFPTQGLNLGLLHCRQMPYHLSHQGSHHSLAPGT